MGDIALFTAFVRLARIDATQNVSREFGSIGNSLLFGIALVHAVLVLGAVDAEARNISVADIKRIHI